MMSLFLDALCFKYMHSAKRNALVSSLAGTNAMFDVCGSTLRSVFDASSAVQFGGKSCRHGIPCASAIKNVRVTGWGVSGILRLPLYECGRLIWQAPAGACVGIILLVCRDDRSLCRQQNDVLTDIPIEAAARRLVCCSFSASIYWSIFCLLWMQ